MSELFLIAINAVLIENYVLVRTIGCCPFLGVSKRTETAVGMGMAVIFTMTLSSGITWAVNKYILVQFELEYMRTVAFILVIATLVQFVEMALKKIMPALYSALGIYLPLITTNCAVMGVTILVQREGFTLFESLFNALGYSLGFFLALMLMAGIREKLDTCRLPKTMIGTPIALVMAGIMSLAFMAFKGMAQ